MDFSTDLCLQVLFLWVIFFCKFHNLQEFFFGDFPIEKSTGNFHDEKFTGNSAENSATKSVATKFAGNSVGSLPVDFKIHR